MAKRVQNETVAPAAPKFKGAIVRYTGKNWQEVGAALRKYQYLPHRNGGKILVNDGRRDLVIIAGQKLKISAERIVVE